MTSTRTNTLRRGSRDSFQKILRTPTFFFARPSWLRGDHGNPGSQRVESRHRLKWNVFILNPSDRLVRSPSWSNHLLVSSGCMLAHLHTSSRTLFQASHDVSPYTHPRRASFPVPNFSGGKNDEHVRMLVFRVVAFRASRGRFFQHHHQHKSITSRQMPPALV